MNYEIEKMVETMADNYELLRKAFIWDHDLTKHLVALQYTLENKRVDVEKIKIIKDHLKSNTGIFSSFRGSSMFAICGLLAATSEDPKKQLDEMINNQNLLKNVGFKNSQYLPTALYALSQLTLEENMDTLLNRAHDIYLDMKKNHPFLTSGDDYAFSILLATSDHSLSKIEAYYEALSKASFTKSNGLQMLSHIMAFHEGDLLEKTRKLEEIYQILKENKIKAYDKAYPALGLLSMLDDSEKTITNFVELVKYLKKMKRYKWLDRNMLMLIAGAILAGDTMKDEVSSTSIQVTIQSIIAAQQAAMIAAVGAASAASAAT
jgi:hypothetical protein